MFEPMRKKVLGGSTKTELCEVSLFIPFTKYLWVIKSRSMSSAVHVGKGTQNFSWKRMQQRPPV
jgi:hypothetical protein